MEASIEYLKFILSSIKHFKYKYPCSLGWQAMQKKRLTKEIII